MKRALRQGLAHCVSACGGSTLLRRLQRKRLVILCYHRVLPLADRTGYAFPDLVVTPEDFAAQVAHCHRFYDVRPLREACAMLAHDEENHRDCSPDRDHSHPHDRSPGCPRPRPLLSITFDDGYWDNLVHAAPILEKANLRATFFVISSLVGATNPPWYDQAARALAVLEPGCDARDAICHLKKLPDNERRDAVEDITQRARKRGWQDHHEDRLMSENDLRRLANAGHEVASHTVTHPILTRTDAKTRATELTDSREAIAKIINQDVVSLAYPNGDHNADVLAATREAGYRYAVTTESGMNDASTDPLALRRIFISEPRLAGVGGSSSRAVFDFELTGAGDALFLRGLRGVRT